MGHRPIGGSVGQVKWHWINNGGNNLMKTLVLGLPGPPLLVMTLVAVVCSIAVADAADSTKIGTSTDGDAGRHSETDQGTGALKTDDLFIDWDIINWDWKKDTDQIAKVGLSESQIAQAAQEEDESAAPKSAQCLEFKRDLHADLGDVLSVRPERS
jgi:hypothetical protein